MDIIRSLTSAQAAPDAAYASSRVRSREQSWCGGRRLRRRRRPMRKELIKGNEAIVKGAILAGCRAYYGYPITPASEIAEAAALYMPPAGGVFLQAESNIRHQHDLWRVLGRRAQHDRVERARAEPHAG